MPYRRSNRRYYEHDIRSSQVGDAARDAKKALRNFLVGALKLFGVGIVLVVILAYFMDANNTNEENSAIDAASNLDLRLAARTYESNPIRYSRDFSQEYFKSYGKITKIRTYSIEVNAGEPIVGPQFTSYPSVVICDMSYQESRKAADLDKGDFVRFVGKLTRLDSKVKNIPPNNIPPIRPGRSYTYNEFKFSDCKIL